MVFHETDILRAFDEGEFFPVFQPLVELRTGQLSGFEVLARWNHKIFGAIAPEDFIPWIEESGLIDRLSRTILESAFAAPVLIDSPLTLAVNISPRQLLGEKLPERIAALAAKSGFPLDRLIIEITESALLDDLARAQSAAREVKELRCKLALDDFGTGYSSLRHLHALPFDELKIDRSFVSSMAAQRESRKIVASVVGLGQGLGLTTVAEGVETQEQASMLTWLGCDLGQGWFHGYPVPASELHCVISAFQNESRVAVPGPMDGDSFVSLDVLPAQRLAQLQAIYDGAPVGLCMLDRNMRYVSLNRRLSQMNGVALSAHLGKTVAEVIPRIFPMVEPYIRRALQGESITGVEVQKPHAADGSESQTLLLSYQPARDEAGEILGVSVAIMDVTSSKRTERALRESENHYRHMMQLNPHVPWVLDSNGEVTEASPRWESFTGQTVEEALGNGWLKALHPDDVEPTLEAIRISLKTGQPIDVEYRVRRPGGEWNWMRSRGSPRFGPTGRVVCIYGVVEGVHEQKQMTEELQNSHAELRTALSAVPVGMVLADAQDCSIYMVNPEADRIFRGAIYPGQKLTDYSKMNFFWADGHMLQAEDFPLSRTMLRGETVDARHVRYNDSDGMQMDLEISSKPIYADDGALIGGLMMIRELIAPDQAMAFVRSARADALQGHR